MPASVTLGYLTTLFPEFAAETDARIAALDDWAAGLVSEGIFGQQFLYAQALLVAHPIALGRQNGTGMLTAERTGDVSRTYAGPDNVKSGLSLTTYGMQYITLARTKTAGPYFVPQPPPPAPFNPDAPQ